MAYVEGSYATDLVSYAPKFNFLFVMAFEFFPTFSSWASIAASMAFVVKTSTRPQVEFDYEEVNMYNFWTRVPKRTIYQPMRATFYDDNQNSTEKLYAGYVRAMSPIANLKPDASTTKYTLQGDSMAYANGSNGYAASLGNLSGEETAIFSRIRLIHVFDYGKLMNVYHFYNPRILEFSPSQLTMSDSGDGGEYEINFAYDSMHPEVGVSTTDTGSGISLKELSGNGTKALHHFLKRGTGESV